MKYMKYKIGDRVKVKKTSIKGNNDFLASKNYIFTIKDYDGEHYLFEEDYMWYSEDSIEYLCIKDWFEFKNNISIESRFEILDL